MAIRTNRQLIDFLTNEKDFSITALDKNNNTVVIVNSDNAVTYFKHKYGTRFYSVLRGVQTPSISEIENDFNVDFRLWILNRQKNINLQYQAMFDYPFNPIENYDRYENEITNKDISTLYGKRNTESGSDSLSMTGTITDANSGTDTTTKSGNIVNETDRAGFNSPNTYTNDTKNTETFNSVKDKTDFGKTETQTHNRTDTTTFGKVDATSGTDKTDDDTLRELHSHGNIGVTTSTQMISETVELYMKSFAELLLDNFINDYTFYC